MKKIAIVVHRFGPEIMGGAEKHAYFLAKELSKIYEVTVLTTCANDYYSFSNFYNEGSSQLENFKVLRFKTDQIRDKKKFDEYSRFLFSGNSTKDEQLEWMKLQGPYSLDLYNFIKSLDGKVDSFIFFTYLYASTYFGIKQISKSKKILVPTAHNEKELFLPIFKDVFENVDGIIFNTEIEKKLCEGVFNLNKKNIIAGIFVENPSSIKYKKNEDERYFVYVGRIDENKGVLELFDFFSKAKSKYKLVIAGENHLKIPDNIDYKGKISDEEKFKLFYNSDFVIVPSKYESLSMLLLESFLFSKPVLVNSKSEVLKKHCLLSNGGLWYDDFESFKVAVNWFYENKELSKLLGKNGNKYFLNNYSKEIVLSKVVKFLNCFNE